MQRYSLAVALEAPMKTLHTIYSALALTTTLVAAPAFAADLVIDEPVVDVPAVQSSAAWYVSGFLGAAGTHVTSDDEFFGDDDDLDLDTGAAYGIAVGTKVFDIFRGELELSGTVQQFGDDIPVESDLYLSTTYLLGNLWFDFDTGSSFTPYIGGGVGYGWASVSSDDDIDELEYDASGFAYQLGAGVRFGLTDNVAFDLGYRFKALPNLEPDDFGGDAEFGVYQHLVQVGVSVSF
jgi:opacity protein-like surface antigen